MASHWQQQRDEQEVRASDERENRDVMKTHLVIGASSKSEAPSCALHGDGSTARGGAVAVGSASRGG